MNEVEINIQRQGFGGGGGCNVQSYCGTACEMGKIMDLR
jgi:hypothetical protein